MKRIPLSGTNRFAIVDDSDYPIVSRFEWRLRNYGHLHYAGTGGSPAVAMHRLVMGCLGERSKIVDHVNGNGLDNRRENLRFCTHTQNYYNARKRKNTTSKYKGVSFFRATGQWRAQLHYRENGNVVRLELGLHDDESIAGRAYDASARQYFKEFARLNFPEPGERSALKHETDVL